MLGQLTKWPTCRDSSITHCTDLPDLNNTGLVMTTGSDPVAVQMTTTVKCETAGETTPTWAALTLTCDYDGQLKGAPAAWPSCQAARACPTVPDAPTGTNLVAAAFTPGSLLEYGLHEYTCADGFTLQGVVAAGVEGDHYNFECTLDDNNATVAPSEWPSCVAVVTECAAMPTGVDGFVPLNPDAAPPFAVGTTLQYACQNPVSQGGRLMKSFTALIVQP